MREELLVAPVKRFVACDACGIPLPEDDLQPMSGGQEVGCGPCARETARHGGAS